MYGSALCDAFLARKYLLYLAGNIYSDIYTYIIVFYIVILYSYICNNLYYNGKIYISY